MDRLTYSFPDRWKFRDFESTRDAQVGKNKRNTDDHARARYLFFKAIRDRDACLFMKLDRFFSFFFFLELDGKSLTE